MTCPSLERHVSGSEITRESRFRCLFAVKMLGGRRTGRFFVRKCRMRGERGARARARAFKIWRCSKKTTLHLGARTQHQIRCDTRVQCRSTIVQHISVRIPNAHQSTHVCRCHDLCCMLYTCIYDGQMYRFPFLFIFFIKIIFKFKKNYK